MAGVHQSIIKILKNSKNESGLLEDKDWKESFSTVVNCHKLIVVIMLSLLDSSCINLRNYALGVLVYIRRSFLGRWKRLILNQLEVLQYPQCVLPPSHQGKSRYFTLCKLMSGRLFLRYIYEVQNYYPILYLNL